VVVDIERSLYESKPPRRGTRIIYVLAALAVALVVWHAVAPRSQQDLIGYLLAPRRPVLISLVVKKGATRQLLKPGETLNNVRIDEPLTVEKIDTNVPFNQGVLIGFVFDRAPLGPRIKAHHLPFTTTIQRLLANRAFDPGLHLRLLVTRGEQTLARLPVAITLTAADRVRLAEKTSDPGRKLTLLLQAFQQGLKSPDLLLKIAQTAERTGEAKLAADFYRRLLKAEGPGSGPRRLTVLARLARLEPSRRNLMALARAYQQTGWPTLAEKALKNIKGWERSPAVLIRLAALLKNNPRRRDEYLATLGRLSRLQPQNVVVVKRYVRLLERRLDRAGSATARSRTADRLREALVKLVRRRPRDLATQQWVVSRLLARGWFKSALPIQERVVKLTHNDPDQRRTMADIYRRLGNVAAAERIEEGLADQLPRNLRIKKYLIMAQQAGRNRQPAEKTRLLEKALNVDRNNLDVRWRLAVHLLSLGKNGEAADHLTFLVRRAPKNRTYRLALAQALTRDRQLGDAARVLDKWLEIRPDDREALLWLLDLRQKLKDRAGQIKVYQRLLARPAGNEADRAARKVYRRNLVVLFLETKNWAAAAALLGRMAAADPQDLSLRELRRETLIRNNDLKAAAAETLALIKAQPRRLDLVHWLADYFQQRKQYPQMASVLKRGLAASPRDLGLLRSLTHAYLLLNDKDSAVGSLKQALKYHPRNRDLRLDLALLLDKSGRFKDALVHYRRLLAADPGNKELLLRVARVYRNLARYKDAVTTFQRLRRLFPGDRKIEAGLKRAQQEYLDSRIASPRSAPGR
jgi:tetratricopeptide (TPR) repeat protein